MVTSMSQQQQHQAQHNGHGPDLSSQEHGAAGAGQAAGQGVPNGGLNGPGAGGTESVVVVQAQEVVVSRWRAAYLNISEVMGGTGPRDWLALRWGPPEGVLVHGAWCSHAHEDEDPKKID